MKALLLLYIPKYHLFGDDAGDDLLGVNGGLVYAVPVRKAVALGAVLLVLGHLGMTFEGEQARMVNGVAMRDESALQVVYLSLALIIIDVGFLKLYISTIVGQLCPPNDARRDSGFTVFYAGINVGALFASLICAYLGETYGWTHGFGAAGTGMVAELVMFLWGQKYLRGLAEPADPAKLRERVGPLSREWWIYLGSLGGTLVVWQLTQRTWTVHYAMHIIAVAFLAWFGWFLAKPCTREQRQQMVSLVLRIIGVLVFFTLYEQTYGSWVPFTDRLLTKDLFGLAPEDAPPALPWAVYWLAISPPLMIAALKASDAGRIGTAKGVIVLMAIGLAVAVAHEVVLVKQTAGSLTFLGAFFIVVLAPVFRGCGHGSSVAA